MEFENNKNNKNNRRTKVFTKMPSNNTKSKKGMQEMPKYIFKMPLIYR